IPQRLPPPPTILPVLEKLKSSYKLWHEYHEKLPKTQKYSLGNRIDKLFIENVEAITSATFLPKTEKVLWLRLAIRKTDTIKILIMILWETKSLEDKKYIALSELLAEIGRMLGGWSGQLQKQNSPTPKAGEK
ncbi:MAG: hypothetical protein G01um101472_578, partial [Parcubacteria group bacterium Gr01-1014_72]